MYIWCVCACLFSIYWAMLHQLLQIDNTAAPALLAQVNSQKSGQLSGQVPQFVPPLDFCLVSTSVCLGPIHLAMCPNRYYIFSKDSIENSESSNFDPSPFLSSCCAQSNFDLSWLIDDWWFIMIDKSSTFRKGIWYPIRPRNLGHGHRQVTSMLRQLFHAQELALVAAFSDRSSCFLWNMGK